MHPRIQIDEEVAGDGTLVGLFLARAEEHFQLLRGDTPTGLLSAHVIIEVVSRYARPLESSPANISAPLVLTTTASLCSWRYRAPVDLEAKLYLLLYRDGREPTAVLARQVASALCFLCGER